MVRKSLTCDQWAYVMNCPTALRFFANPTASREILTLGTVCTIREQARSYRHNRGGW